MKLKLKVYRGFASDHRLYISGHVFKKTDPSNFNLENSWLRYAYYMWRTFSIKTLPGVAVNLKFRDLQETVVTDENGFFKFELEHELQIESGWHELTCTVVKDSDQVMEKGSLLKAASGYGIISDIDDTFLVSHSSSILKKIYILLTRNINKRKIFHDVVQHYRELAHVDRPELQPALFFYVSSSEWNLYNFIEKFTILHQFPKAVFFLKSIKSGVFDLLASGGGNHDHKLHRIQEILEFYPDRFFVLLGDDTQQDPFIYRDITKQFPNRILAVYLRQVGGSPKSNVESLLSEITSKGVPNCYFENSATAREHSKVHMENYG
ncbi:Uncharacterized conserved protein [Nonlabens sp. Hel1_33_55]|uniref:App1 family protein n=1 Tax=Nonlabens sp. Hel1_33_55 TaxID=1336802 RepID=UPI000875E655|nr:phosphatase domain-containing protein [Nonlabens sp. Hel1_33_55]SCY27969.1 Uncharacterized conserved protein [Nonlabens sp. Hel1_33_55]